MHWCNAVIFSFFFAAGAAAQDYPAAGDHRRAAGRGRRERHPRTDRGAAAIAASRQQFVVENRVGAGGNIGTAATAKAPRDGYTLSSRSARRTRSIPRSTRSPDSTR